MQTARNSGFLFAYQLMPEADVRCLVTLPDGCLAGGAQDNVTYLWEAGVAASVSEPVLNIAMILIRVPMLTGGCACAAVDCNIRVQHRYVCLLG